MQIDTNGEKREAKKVADGVLEVAWKNGKLRFEEDRITVTTPILRFYFVAPTAVITQNGNTLDYKYKGTTYSLAVQSAAVKRLDDHYEITPEDGTCVLLPQKR